jgi:hypothetical protein
VPWVARSIPSGRKALGELPAPAGEPPLDPERRKARRRRAFVALLVGAVALALSAGVAIALDRAVEPEIPENPALGEVAVDEAWSRFLTAVIWIAWCIGAVLIGVLAVRKASRELSVDADPLHDTSTDPTTPRKRSPRA